MCRRGKRAARAQAGLEKYGTPEFQTKHTTDGFKTTVKNASLSPERAQAIDAEVTALPPIDSKTHQYKAVLPRTGGGSAVITVTLATQLGEWKVDECVFDAMP